MIVFCCDKCGTTIPGSTDIADRCPAQGKQVTPGYVGVKLLCNPCYDRWVEAVREFFKQ